MIAKINLVLTVLSFCFFSFTSNADASNLLLFGRGIDVWLVYTLIFFGLTSIAFMGTWLSGLIVQETYDESQE